MSNINLSKRKHFRTQQPRRNELEQDIDEPGEMEITTRKGII